MADEIAQINAIITSWTAAASEFAPATTWVVTLTTGQRIIIRCPLGAAVELERSGWDVRVVMNGDQLLATLEWHGVGLD